MHGEVEVPFCEDIETPFLVKKLLKRKKELKFSDNQEQKRVYLLTEGMKGRFF